MRTAVKTKPKYLSYLISTTIASSVGLTAAAHAETKALEEVFVTAQKREQSVQEVPVAITAMTQEALETNRVANVADLSGMAPNLTVRPAAGGTAIASFSMRGVTSYGVVPGSDKEISIYLDGVYVGSPRGSIFSLPDVSQLEVLRGPQGTLFGRNATAGAINITTRDPAGKFGLRQDFSAGDHGYRRTRTSIDSPTWGAFSIAGTYAKEERDGDIKNLGAGTVWDRTAFGEGYDVSPKRLGDKDTENYFLAVKFQPTDTFSMTFKADRTTETGTPDAIAPDAVGTLTTGGFGGAIVNSIYAQTPNQPPLSPSGKRPRAVNNAFTTPIDQLNWGESLTTVVDVDEHLTIKNITAYRKTQVTVATDLTGLGGMQLPATITIPGVGTLPSSVLGAGAVPGAPVCVVCTQNDNDSDQWSSELQANYESELMTVTLGALYYTAEDRSGGPVNSVNTISLAPLPGNVIPTGHSISYNEGNSVAAYSQMEYHLNDELDLVGGLRETRDRKSGDYVAGAFATPMTSSFRYEHSEPSYTVGVNYKPTFDTLVYAKLSRAYVSGGSVGGVEFNQETAKSWEGGIKSDFLDSRLRSNLSVFYTNYTDIQSAQSGTNVGHPELGTLIVTQGPEAAKGFEWEGMASVGYGVTLNGSLGYTHIHFGEVNPVVLASVSAAGPTALPNSTYNPILIPDWTGSLSAQYDSQPLFEQSYVSFNVSGNWHDGISLEPNDARAALDPAFQQVDHSPASWVVNSRLALKKINLGFGGGEGEIALWGRNMNDNKYPTYALNFGGLAVGTNYLQERSYGVDFTAKF